MDQLTKLIKEVLDLLINLNREQVETLGHLDQNLREKAIQNRPQVEENLRAWGMENLKIMKNIFEAAANG